MQLAQTARPPFVSFEYRAVEDRAASIEAGHFVATDIAFAVITPHGSKDKIDRVVDDWFVKLEGDVRSNRFPPEWLRAIKNRFEAWTQDQELATDGLDIRMWPPIKPAELKVLQEAGVRSVEDLAAANSEMLGRIGMGSQALKSRAKEWLESAANVGKSSEQVAALRVEKEQLVREKKEAQERIAKLEAQVELLQKSRKL